jgi:hypothetical protein
MRFSHIAKSIVVEALANPDKILAGKLNRGIALKKHKDRWIKVIFEGETEVIMNTAYWTRRIR